MVPSDPVGHDLRQVRLPNADATPTETDKLDLVSGDQGIELGAAELKQGQCIFDRNKAVARIDFHV